MPRVSGSTNLDEIIRAAIAPVLERASAAIAKAMAEVSEARISRELARPSKRQAQPRGRKATASHARRNRNVEMTEWTADRRARRVPTFVIEATKLDTKKKIVAQFGEGATFLRGKPLPTPLKVSNQVAVGDLSSASAVKAKGPRVRKASGA
jgi:hypothetical protein